MAEKPKARRRKRRFRGARQEEVKPKKPVIWPGMVGGRYQPLTQREMERIHETALDLLENVGMAQAIPSMIEIVTGAGGWMNEHGRLCYPRSLVEDILGRAPRKFVMPGQDPKHDLEVGGRRVYCGTGGAAPMIVDFETGRYRETRLVDLYDIARLVDTLDNIHYFWRTVVARDMPTPLDLDVNTAYACMHGTTKHIGVSYVNGDHVREAVAMFDMLLEAQGGFRNRPFCSISCCHVVPPLRFAEESCEALEAAVRAGMPITLLSAAQAGATSPAALAGTIVQAIAEVLAGLVFCLLIDPNCRANLGTWPFVSDLRTGAMCSGSAELGLLVAACAQMGGFYDLPMSTAAGMSDSKVPDAQAGAEKAYTIALAANAGATLIMESAGMHASLLGTAHESFVIDNDMLGAVQRTVRGIEVTDETLSYDVIKRVVHGEGHFLGESQTIERMETDYFYPKVGDRESFGNWEDQGSTTVRQRARAHTRKVLAQHYPTHIDPKLDARIREHFNIFLPPRDMKRGNGRW
ncbi:MAG: trimethylamine methyltransferase family protein [Ardenticatenaceae bacterium]